MFKNALHENSVLNKESYILVMQDILFSKLLLHLILVCIIILEKVIKYYIGTIFIIYF